MNGNNRKIASFRRITIKTRRDEMNPEHHKIWNTSSSKRFCVRPSSIRNSASKDDLDFGISGAGLAYLFLKFSGWA